MSTAAPHKVGSADDLPRATVVPAPGQVGLLLACGVAAGPLFLGSTLTQAGGFDMRRHAASLLSNGDLGWIQTLTFLVTGVAVTAAAVGLGRALRSSPGASVWGPRLLLVYGVSFVAAAVFPADPTLGFPLGTPDGPGVLTTTGIGHMISGLVGFLAVIVAAGLFARSQLLAGTKGRGLFSATTSGGFAFALVGIMSGSGSASAGVTLGFWAAIASSLAWLASTSRWAGRIAARTR